MPGRHRAVALALASALVLGAATVSGAETVLAPGESHGFPLSASEGSYVAGRLVSTGAPVDLDLTGPEGTPLRQLLRDSLGNGAFHLVAGAGPSQLRVTNAGGAAASVTLHLDRVVPPEQQVARLPDPYLSPTIAGLADRLQAGGDTAAFWAARRAEGTPMVEPAARPDERIVTFLWRGAQRNARLWGGPAYDHTWMQRLGDSDVWFASFTVPDDLRLTYGIAPDVPQFAGDAQANRRALLATLQADPLNRAPVYAGAPDVWAQRSQLVLPNAPQQPGMAGPAPARRGRIVEHRLSSARLGQDRRVAVYLPAGVDPAAPETVLLVLFDGPAYRSDRAPVPRILDQLIAEGRLPPVVALMVDPVDSGQRARDLTCNPDFTDALANELVPQIAARLGLRPDPRRTVIAGSSYGGLAAAYATHRRPEVFGNAVVLSGSFWWAPEGYAGQGLPYMSSLWMEARMKAPPDAPVRLWISAGRYEAARTPGSQSILETSRHLRDVLRLTGVEARYREYSGGHDYLVWRGALADGLLWLFGNG